MEPTLYSPDDTIPAPPPSRDYETRPRDTIPCPPPPSSVSPVTYDLTAEYLEEE